MRLHAVSQPRTPQEGPHPTTDNLTRGKTRRKGNARLPRQDRRPRGALGSRRHRRRHRKQFEYAHYARTAADEHMDRVDSLAPRRVKVAYDDRTVCRRSAESSRVAASEKRGSTAVRSSALSSRCTCGGPRECAGTTRLVERADDCPVPKTVRRACGGLKTAQLCVLSESADPGITSGAEASCLTRHRSRRMVTSVTTNAVVPTALVNE